jgi:hypothetical protein
MLVLRQWAGITDNNPQNLTPTLGWSVDYITSPYIYNDNYVAFGDVKFRNQANGNQYTYEETAEFFNKLN